MAFAKPNFHMERERARALAHGGILYSTAKCFAGAAVLPLLCFLLTSQRQHWRSCQMANDIYYVSRDELSWVGLRFNATQTVLAAVLNLARIRSVAQHSNSDKSTRRHNSLNLINGISFAHWHTLCVCKCVCVPRPLAHDSCTLNSPLVQYI